MDNRPSWEEYFSDLIKLTAKRSACSRLKVGCMLIRDNRIISQGYNGFIAGCSHRSIMRNGHEMATVHAEQNAIVDCAKRGVSCDGATAYITHFPCLNCAKLLLSAGIINICYIDDYNNDEMVYTILKERNCKLKKIESKNDSVDMQAPLLLKRKREQT